MWGKIGIFDKEETIIIIIIIMFGIIFLIK